MEEKSFIKGFLFLALAAILFKGGSVWAILVEGHQMNIPV